MTVYQYIYRGSVCYSIFIVNFIFCSPSSYSGHNQQEKEEFVHINLGFDGYLFHTDSCAGKEAYRFVGEKLHVPPRSLLPTSTRLTKLLSLSVGHSSSRIKMSSVPLTYVPSPSYSTITSIRAGIKFNCLRCFFRSCFYWASNRLDGSRPDFLA